MHNNDSDWTPLSLVTARKIHYCTTCHRQIPIGVKYWREYTATIDTKEHTNCLLFEGNPTKEEAS